MGVNQTVSSVISGVEPGLLDQVRAVIDTHLVPLVPAIDQQGLYPKDVMCKLGEAGAMSAHLAIGDGQRDYALAIQSIAEVSKVCMSTGFMMWCQAVCGLYLEQSASEILRQRLLPLHAKGVTLGGTALSNPMKTFAGIESMLLKARKVSGGWLVSGRLPWVSNLGSHHYCGAIARVESAEDGPLMFLLRCDASGVRLRECPRFSGMEGTGTFAIDLDDCFVPDEDVIAEHAKPLIRRIRSAFVMLQCGMAIGVIQGAIDSMMVVEGQSSHVNQYLEDRPDAVQRELDDYKDQVMRLARTPFEDSDAFFVDVLAARLHGSELSLRAAQSALLHQGARGYTMQSPVQRRVRESHFVAIVTPAIKHLRSEIARLSQEEHPA